MIDFKLPDLGEGVAEGQIVGILVNEGDSIEEFQPMLEVETDKAAVEIPAPSAGVIAKLHVEAGQTVKVGEVLISIDEAANAGDAKPKEKPTESAKEEPPKEQAVAPAEKKPEAKPSKPSSGGPIAAAPVVRKLARELGVDLASVTPTGPKGRVLREDVERTAKGEKAPAGTKPSLPPISSDLPDFSQYGPVRREPAPQIRKTIAKQMTSAWLNVPRVTQHDSADVTELNAARKAYNADLKDGEQKLTVTAVVVKAIAAALKKHPNLNCSYDAENGEIVFKEYINIGLAVDTPRGLVVPVLKDADKKPVPALAAEMATLVEKVRTGKFEISDIRGATFTITNVGPLGGKHFTPMVNFPEVAILGLGRATMEAVVRDGQVVPRLMLPISISYDHRIVDGADGTRFTVDIVQALENPLKLISLI